jgi:hypothetical protein
VARLMTTPARNGVTTQSLTESAFGRCPVDLR